MFIVFIVMYILFFPTSAFAWGPLTHIYLGNEVFALASLLPAGIYEIIRRYRKDFLYGTLMADLVVGKKYLPIKNNAHTWDFAFDLFKAADTKQQRAFVYGYLGHLAADTVAHTIYIADKKNISHTLFEMKADCIIDKKHYLQAMDINRKIQLRNDIFLENSLQKTIFSFKTNKRILRGMVFLTACYPEGVGDFIDRNLVTYLPVRERIEKLHGESLKRIIDIYQNGNDSEVVKINPIGSVCRRKTLRSEMKAFLLKERNRKYPFICGGTKRSFPWWHNRDM